MPAGSSREPHHRQGPFGRGKLNPKPHFTRLRARAGHLQRRGEALARSADHAAPGRARVARHRVATRNSDRPRPARARTTQPNQRLNRRWWATSLHSRDDETAAANDIWAEGNVETPLGVERPKENQLNNGVVRSYDNILRRWSEIKQPRRILETTPR